MNKNNLSVLIGLGLLTIVKSRGSFSTLQEKSWLAGKEHFLMTGDQDTFLNTLNLITSLYVPPIGIQPPYTRFESGERLNLANRSERVFKFTWSFDSYKDGLEFFNIMKAMPSLKKLWNLPHFYRHYNNKGELTLEYLRESGANEDPEEDFSEVIITFITFSKNMGMI